MASRTKTNLKNVLEIGLLQRKSFFSIYRVVTTKPAKRSLVQQVVLSPCYVKYTLVAVLTFQNPPTLNKPSSKSTKNLLFYLKFKCIIFFTHHRKISSSSLALLGMFAVLDKLLDRRCRSVSNILLITATIKIEFLIDFCND